MGSSKTYFPNLGFITNPDPCPPASLVLSHVQYKIGKFFPRKTARPQIEAAIPKPLHKLHKDLCQCTQSRLYRCTKLSKLAFLPFKRNICPQQLICLPIFGCMWPHTIALYGVCVCKLTAHYFLCSNNKIIPAFEREQLWRHNSNQKVFQDLKSSTTILSTFTRQAQ